MIEFYYQIKGKSSDNKSEYWQPQNWSFPPIFSGKVTATNKKEAKLLIEEEYGNKFPLRVLKKDLDSNEFLLSIREITDDRTRSLFELRECIHCKTSFRVIDSYNNKNLIYKGSEYCSDKCKCEKLQIDKLKFTGDNDNFKGYRNPIIYKIHNNVTNQCYVGKTTQVFTLRWYQHFYQGGGTKFHNAIQDSIITDWSFDIIEIINIPDHVKSIEEIGNLVFERESYWINHFDSVDNGYNSFFSKKSKQNG